VVVGRTLERAREVAPRLGAEPRSWEDFPALLVEADIVVSSTSAPGYVVTQDQFGQTRRLRHGRNLFLVDLAVPRDIDPRIADLPGVFLYNVDDLAKVAEAALTDRRREAEKAAAIVSEETDSFLRRVHAERISPTLVALRDRFRGALEAELERSMRGHRMPLDEQQKESLHKALAAAVEKTLHLPTERLRAWAKDTSFGDWHTDLLLAAIEELFDLPRSTAQEPLAKESSKP
jgi:glutamyl-tRNA reductase